jgi:hypothetical protein
LRPMAGVVLVVETVLRIPGIIANPRLQRVI